jgi:anti-sigma factor RsiW
MTRRPRPARGCESTIAALLDYLEGDLTAPRCRQLERHLAECGCCGTLAENLRRTIDICRAEGKRQVPATVRARARKRVAALLGRRRTTD